MQREEGGDGDTRCKLQAAHRDKDQTYLGVYGGEIRLTVTGSTLLLLPQRSSTVPHDGQILELHR